MAPALGNALIGALPASVADRVRPLLTRRHLKQRTTLQSAKVPTDTICFPLDAVASVVVPFASGQAVEAALIGYEGAIGLPLFGRSHDALETFIQLPGECLLMRPEDFREQLEAEPEFRRASENFVGVYLATVAQTAGCNRVHPTELRLARWLLMIHDRIRRDTLEITQEFLATMLGVQRPLVTTTLGTLRRAGIIHGSYGRITILDRAGLEDAACECYRVIREIELR